MAKMGPMETWDLIAKILLIVGGLNWGLVGLFNFNLVSAIGIDIVAKIVYILVFVSALWLIYAMFVKK